MLLTEYKNQTAYDEREELFDSIRKKLLANTVLFYRPEDFYQTLTTRLFDEFTDDLSQTSRKGPVCAV